MTAASISLIVLFVVAAVPLAPTEAVLIGTGVLAATGDLPLLAVIAVAAAGCTVADMVNFRVGQTYGMRAMRWFNRSPKSRATVVWTADQLTKRGESILIAVRFVPAGGILGAVLAGSLKWPLRRFLPVAAAGATLWSAYTATIGYVGGQLVSEPLLAVLLSIGVAMLISVPVGMAIRARNATRALS